MRAWRRASLVALLLIGNQVEAAKAVLTWTAPTRNTDGTALTNLAGYKVLYRRKGTTTWIVKTVASPGATGTTIWNLPTGVRYQFAVKSYNNVGVQSVRTGIVEKLM